ncbi:diguanylate cyclase [bacterium]|nr:diguanylate cyclase [bacterium]MBU1990551.1 diguanylate cyclase [bacterium]
MKNLYKHIILYIVFALSVFALYTLIDVFSKKNLEFQKEILVTQAQTHFNNQVNTRKWNASYGGVYVKPQNDQKPNPYLKDNILKVDENLTLIKINPAWMTRQLSELSNVEGFHFRITSLNPINPNNTTSPFEKKALEYFEATKMREYYEFGDTVFNYMGALETTQDCLYCHRQQGYKLGDIRGGISLSLESSKYNAVADRIKRNALMLKFFVLIFLLSITLLIHKQLKDNEKLEFKVASRTKEIESTKELLQKILDSELSFLVLCDGTEVKYVNKTMLDFFGFETLSELKNRYSSILDAFEALEGEHSLNDCIEGEHWTKYLHREQSTKELKLMITKDGVTRYFKPHVKDILLDNKTVYVIIFDDITNVLKQIHKLEHEASTDALTKLPNRAKFNDVLLKEMALSDESAAPLSLIFIDIDYFKRVNDNYGHDEGDNVLIGLSETLLSTLRQGDFVARWGGEEFIVVLHSTKLEQAVFIAEKIRVKFEKNHFPISAKQTISCGVTEYIHGENKDTLLKRADEALYEAKEEGRNRVVVK